MTFGEIVDAIWELPWYKVIAIAIVDDFIVLLKLWWLWAAILLICIFIVGALAGKR